MPTPQPSSYCVDCDGPCLHLHIHGFKKPRVKSGGNLTIVGKRLTDRKIEAYKKQGYYGNGILALQRKEHVEKKRKKSKPLTLKAFL